MLSDTTVDLDEVEGVLVLTINGEEFVLAAEDDEEADPRQYKANFEDGSYIDLFNYTGNIIDLQSDSSGAAELLTMYSDPGGDARRTYFIVGSETTDEALAGLTGSTVQYIGLARISANPETSFEGEDSTWFLNGTLELLVSFDSSTLSGTMDGLVAVSERNEGGNRTSFPTDGAILFDSASFEEGNAFQGTLSADSTLAMNTDFLLADAEAVYAGAFYGDAGEEIAGTITGEGTFQGEAYNFVGGFHTEED